MKRALANGFVPFLFVFLWSTGFIGAKYGLPYADPMTFVAIRFGIVFLLMLGWAFVTQAAWPTVQQSIHIAFVGILMHAGFMGTIFVAIAQGVEAGTAALIAALQPILSALMARPLLGERTTRRQWGGLGLGLLGVSLVVGDKLGQGVGSPVGIALCLLALVSLSLGTIWQKKHGSDAPVRSGYVIQFAAAFAVTLVLAVMFEPMSVRWTGAFIFALSWLIVAISIGAVALLYAMLRQGAASRVSSLFFLTPISTALIGWGMFGEDLSATALCGIAIAATGVLIAMGSR